MLKNTNMKISILIILLSHILVGTTTSYSGCEMTVTYAELSYMSFKKVYGLSDMSHSEALIKDGILKATEASAFAIAPQCKCENAKNYSLNAVTFGNKALRTEDRKEKKKLVKKAMDMSLDAMTAVNSCNLDN